jgi:hypothetical protein
LLIYFCDRVDLKDNEGDEDVKGDEDIKDNESSAK